MSELQNLGLKHGTDKADARHMFNGESYLHVYERYFSPTRESVKNVLEIGIYRGQSLRMWADYFPNAEIWGVDCDEKAIINYGPRIRAVHGRQEAPLTFDSNMPAEFDIVIDDGGHENTAILASFEHLWPRVRSGGFYVIEDLWMTYQTFYLNNVTVCNQRTNINAFITTMLNILDYQCGNVRAIHFHSMQMFIQKV